MTTLKAIVLMLLFLIPASLIFAIGLYLLWSVKIQPVDPVFIQSERRGRVLVVATETAEGVER